jgi:hypothetical protein
MKGSINMKSKSLLPTIFAIVLTSTAAMAQQPAGNGDLISRLEQAKRDCLWSTRNLKGAPQGNMLLHQRTMENVLQQLKAGQSVEQQKIEKAFEGHHG